MKVNFLKLFEMGILIGIFLVFVTFLIFKIKVTVHLLLKLLSHIIVWE